MKLYLPKELQNNEISLPETIKEVLETTGIIQIDEQINIRGKTILLSYADIIGDKIKGIDYPFIEVHEQTQIPFTNEFQELQKSKKIIQELAKKFKINHKFNHTKHLMVNGATLPIKLTLSGKDNQNTFYVKKANQARIIGTALYNMITETNEGPILYNSKTIIEPELQGQLASKIDERLYLTDPNYREELGKLAAISDYLGLVADVAAPKNRIIGKNRETKLFDFDGAFINDQYQQGENPIIKYFSSHKGKNAIDKSFLDGFLQGLKEISQKLQNNLTKINLISQNGDSITLTNQSSLNQNLRLLYGTNNLTEYTEEKIKQYKNI